ncbi:MAG: hypothetical protein Q8L55_06770 [Phycisphaerales bacterium]|nr:hypothetical protein [Phycisphaerales bacterium]
MADSAPIPPPPTDGPATLKRFPCRQCGATLEFSPGTSKLTCPYCRAENDIGAQEQVQELDYHAALGRLRDAAPSEQVPVVHCDSCGANVTIPERAISFSCPFCAANIVSQARACSAIRPNAVLPFRITRDKAVDAFRQWLKSRWFAPSALKREGRLDASINGLYIPAWTYDTDTVTAYTGQRGDAYYTTHTRIVNGKTQTYTVRHIRWSYASGTVGVNFDDVLVEATATLDREDLEHLRPWDLKGCLPYRDEYLAGFRAEAYPESLDLDNCFESAKAAMQPQIDSAIRSDIGGDEQRIDSRRTQYNRLTFKNLLLPVWVSAYRYQNKVYRFLVNARTGEVRGQRPWSAWKIAGLVACGVVIAAVVAIIVAANR